MADNSGFGKDPLATSHGDALADQSFQSLKSKEIRDSLSPTEMKFQSMALNNPNTTGWNVQSSKEVSPDGRGFRAETVATTDGVESINGGTAEFKGRNEQRSSAHHQGDDKNFVKQAMESSNSHLQEKVVIGDENSGRTEVRTSSSKSTSSSQVFQSSSNVEYDDGFPRHQPQPQKYLMDSSRPYQHDLQQQHQQEQQRLLEEQRRYEQQFQQQRQQHHNQQERHTTEQLSTTRQNTEQKNISQNVQTQETHEQNKRYVDMDKASPEYQQHVQYLMQQPGEIISNTVEYPKPNVKMITTVKRLPDGTIVRNKRYETEEVTPTTPTTRTTSTATNQTQPRRDSQQQPSRNYPTDSAPHPRRSQDMVDSSNTSRYVQDTHTDDVETKFSSVKKSSSKFSTQTTSETVQEFDDRYPQGEPRPKPVTNDFSTQGFPSVRSNKPTQEYPTERPHTQRPTQGFPSQGTPSKPTEAMVPHYTDATDNNITERRVNTKDGEVIIVSSEKKRNYKTSTNSERIVETEHIVRDDQPYQQIPDKSQDYTTHGFPSAREPAGQQPKNYPSDRQMQPHEQDFPLDKFSPGPRIVKPRSSPHGDDDVVVVSSQKSRTAKHSTNTERVIEHEIIRDDQPSGYPRIQPSTDNSPYNYTVTTPGEQKPQAEFPGTPRKPNNVDYSTQGFPSVRTPGQTAPGDREPYGDYPAGTPKSPSNDYSTHGYPSATTPSRPAAGLPSSHKQHPSQPMRSPSQEHPTQGFPSVRTPSKGTPTQGYPSNVDGGRPNGTVEQPRATPTSKTQPRTPSPNKYKAPTSTVRETTERVIRKEKEVDSAHRAFAASLRSSSPIDHVRRDSYTTDSHTRHTPRSSVSSTKTFRRDMREGSHDSAPSETSRISTTTITRNTPPRTVGGRTVVTKVVTTKTNQGSNDTLNVTSPRATKSPSPGKTVTTTTTTTRTMTSKDVPKVTEKSPTKKPQPAPSSRSSTPSYNSRKPPTSEMTDDYDDADKLKPTSPLSPSSRSRTPQKIGPNDNDKPQDDWQTRPQPDNDERRTVNRETTFEKDENVPAQPRKPNYEQPNVEWVIVDDGDDYDHDDDDDNDSFAPEVVDSKLNVKKTTLKLITQEKQTPVAPQRRPKPTTTTTVITKQTHTIPSYKPQTKPNDRSPLKIKPGDSRTPQQVRPQKPLTDSKSPVHAPVRGQPKVVDNKQMPKGPKSTAPSYTSPLRKPLPKTTTEETTLRKTLKTSQVIKEKTNKLIEAEKPKRTPQSPERKPKSQTPGYKVTVTEVTQKRTTPEQKGRKPQTTTKEPIENIPYETDDEPVQGRPSFKKPHGVDNEPNERIPGFKTPVDTDDEPHQGSPSYRKPYDTDDEPHQGLPGHRKPYDTDEEPNQHTPGYTKPEKTGKEPTQSSNEPHIYDEPIHNIPGYRQPQETQDEPTQGSPGFRKPQNIYEEPNQHTPGYRKPQETGDKPNQETPGFKKPQSTVEEPKKVTSTPRKPPSPGFKRLQDTFDERSPDYKKPVNFDDEPNQGSPMFRKPQGTNDEPSYRIPGSTKPQDNDDFEPNRPGYEKPKRIVEEQITITETSEERYPEREAPKRPDTKPNQYSPNRYPQDTDDEPGKRTPGYKKPYDEEPYHTSRKPYDTDDEPRQYTPGHGKPYDQEPNQSRPGFRQPVYKDNEPNEGTLTFKKPLDSEPKEGLPQYLIPQQVIEEEITITETSQKRYPDKETPQGTVSKPGEVSPGSRKPHDMGDKPSQGKPGTPGRVNPNEEPTTPGYRNQPLRSVPKYTKPGDKPLDDDECITESVTTTSQKTVAKHIQKFETNLNKKSPKPQPRTKSPTKELPQTQKKTPKTPLKETSPTRSETKPKVGKPRSDKPFETDEDEIFVETNEFIINSKQKRIVSEKQILEEQESTYPSKHPKKPTREVSPTGNQRKPSQKYVEEPADKHPKTPKHVSPTRTPQKPMDDECFETTLTTKQVVTQKTTQQLVDEYPKYPDQKTPRGISPTRNLKKPEEPTGKRPQSPNKNVSPTRQQKQPEQKSPTKPTDGRPKSPSKHVSPIRTQKKPHEKTPLDDVQYTTTLQTTKIVREKITKDDEEYPEKQPKNVKPMIGEPRDTDDDETFIETSELITNSTQKRIVSEKQITSTEESIHPGRKAPKIPTQNKPGQKSPEEPLNRRSQSPTKPVSPTRTQKKPGQTTPVDDQTFRKTLRTTETITEKLTKKVDGKEYPKDKMPTKKGDKPEQTKPKGQKPHSDHPSDTEEDETITETTEFVINTTNKRIVTEQDIHEFPDNKSPKYPDTQKPKSPTRGVSPIRKQPGEQQPEGRPKEPTGKRPQSPNRHVSPTRTQKKPNEKTPVDDDETFTTSYTTTKIVKENLTKKVDDKEYPEEEFPSKKDDKPEKSKTKTGKPYSDQPSDTEEDETVTETSEFIIKSTNKRIVTEQNIQEFEEPQYPDNKSPKYPVNQKPERVSKSPTRGVSPTRKPTGEQKPEERLKEPTGRRPQSPNKHVSPTRTQKKPVDDDETFKTSYTTTKIVTKKVDGKEYPEEGFPSKKDDKPEKSKPKPGKPYSDQPSDTEEDETVTETSEFVIKTTNKRTVTEQNIQEFEEPRYPDKKSPKYPDTQKPERVSGSPTRGVSPTRKQPGQQQPEPIGRRPQSPNKHVSPTRTQKKPNEKTPVDNVETFTTTKIVKEKITKETDDNEYSPKGRKPHSARPIDEDETLVETSEYIINSTQKRVISEKQILEIEDKKTPKPTTEKDSKSPTRGVSPTRTPKRPGQKLPEEPDLKEPTGKRPLSPTKLVSPTRNQRKPIDGTKPRDEPLDSEEYETFTTTSEHVINSKRHTVTEKITSEFEEPKSPTRGISPTRTQKKPGQKLPEEPEFKEPTGKRPQSPTRAQKKPGQQTPTEPIGKRPQSPTRTTKKHINDDETYKTTLKTTKTVTEKTMYVDDEDYPDEETPYKRGDKPDYKPKERKPYSDKPSDTEEDETITETSERFISSKTCKVIENLVHEFEEPESPIRGVSPTRTQKKPGQKTPEEPDYKEPTGKGPQSPTRVQKKPGQSTPKEPSDKRPQSPTRTQKKPTKEDETFKSTLRTTKTVTERTTKHVDDEEYPDEETPYKRGDKPDYKPKERKPYSDKPSDTEEDETITETTERFISSKTCKVTENLVQEFEEPESPIRGVSPTRTQKKPGQKTPEEPDFKEPTGKRPQSPTRVQKKPGQSTPKESDKRPQSPTRTQKKPTKEDETFKSTLRTTKTVTEKTTKYVEDEEYPEEKTPYKKGDKPDNKPKQRKPKSDEPCETDEEEFYTETISSKTSRVTKETMQEFDRPKSPSRGVSPTQKRPEQESEPTGKRPQSPTRNQKFPNQTMPEDEQTITETWRTTKIIKENVTKTFEDEEFPEEKHPIEKRPKSPKKDLIPDDDDQTFTKTTEDTPYGEEPRQSKPKSYKPTETDGDKETFMQTTEFVIKSTHKPEYPDEETQPKYVRPGFEKPKDKRVVHTSDFIRTEKQTLETEKELLKPVGPKGSPSAPNKQRSPTRSPSPKDRKGPKDSPVIPKDRKDSPTRSPSPKGPKSGPKSTTVDDETFRKTLRTTEIFTDKTTKTKPDKIKPKDRKPEDDEETTSETEEYLIETCKKRYVTSEKEDQLLSTTSVKPKPQKPSDTKPQEKEPLQTKPKTQQPSDNEPETGKPVNKPFTSTYVETVETIEGQTYPEDLEQFPDNKKPYSAPLEPWLTEEVPKRTTKVNEQFIETERIRKETPDGAFISKTTEPTSPTTPTYKKKGTGRSDTFEERCRQILGMETYGDTPGTFKKQPITETEEKKTVITKDVKTKEVEDIKNTTVFQVKIEDCDEDDEPLSINSVKKTLHKQIHTKEQNEPLREEPKSGKKPFDEPETKEPQSTKKPVKEPKYPKDDENEFVQTITETTTIHKKTPKTKPIDKTEPDSSEPETVEQHFVEINKETKKSEVKIIKKSSPTSSPRSASPTKSTTTPRTVSPTKPKSSPRNESPLKETPKRKPSKDTMEPKTNKPSPQKPDDDTTTTIKDRLRSSTRKTKSPGKQDQVDGSDSSPERSPNRGTERRRSSNISVTTEIIIEHTDSDTPNKKEKSPVPKKPKDSVYKEIIDSTVLPEKLTRRMLVTERKESAPVHRVTNKDKDSKMSRSTSENLIKVKKPEPQSLSPKTTPKTTDHRRPNKCFATKSINLSATDRLVNSEDMENVIIDIQHAKSSREPSPDKIVPTPVPAHLDTGKPRYPDVVQEPEDDQPRRKPQVKNIPIFEEESNAYVGCHITEVERTHKTTYDSLDYEEQILNNPVVEAPPSLDYPSLDKPTYDESLLTVHEKVSKFQNIAEEVSKPKASEPFQREFDDSFKVPENDECLLTINEKVEKFVKTSERVNEPKTKSPYDLDDEDEEFARNERIYTSVKLAPSAPQKSPELVRTISRHISRQNEPDSEEQQPGYNDNEATEVYPSTSRNDDFVECLVNNKKITKEFEVSHHQQQQQKAIETTLKTAEKYQQPKDHDDDNDDDDDELIPHTATHTTKIEERRQKDILSRPSVFDSKNKKPTTSTTTTTITTSKTPLKCNKSPVKDSEKLRPDIKSRTKPTSAVTNTITETTTTTTTANKQPKQSPQRKNSDIDYELRGSGVETGVRNIISKQTKVYNSNNIVSSSGSTKTNDLKKPTTSNKKPEKHMPVRLTPAKNSDEYDLSADDDEMIITCDETKTTTETNIDFETQVVNEDLTQETTRKIPLTTPHKNQPTPHSSTNSSTTDQSLKSKTKEHVENLTERNPLKPNTVTTTSIKTTYETVERPDDIDETVLEPSKKKPSSSHPNKTTKMSTTITDSVAARRSLFESNHSSPSATPTKRTPLTSPMTGRRPSYMDHTKSSLEHTRRDSLEINKTNYSRKPSHPEEEGIDRNSLVKFDVPQGKRATTPRATSVTEDINVEEIFDLEVLEKLLETVQSYEIRRRIRAQIRLIKKNQKNELITSTTEVTTKTIKTSKVSSEEPDTVSTTVKKTKPETKTTTQTVSTEGAKHVTSSKKEYIFDEPYMPTTRRSPKPNRYPYEPEKEPVHKPTRSQSPQSLVCRRNAEHERHYERSHHSPEHRQDTEVVREYGSRTTKQQYYYKDEQEHEQVEEITHETSPTRKSPSPTRKPHSIHSSPERRNASPDSHKPLKTNERSRSPQTKAPHSTRVTSSRSPDNKTSSSTVRKSSATYEQQETVKSSTTKPQTKRITTTTTTITKSKPEDKTPVWADRKNILKAPSSTTPTPKKPSTSTLDSRSGYTKTVKSTTSQRMSSNKSSFMDDDCVTSSYGIGPTDENGLPLFGIRALKKKKPTVEPSETTEVTGYVVEEKYYSDNKTKPSVERKEFIYSTNPEELQKLKEQVEVSSNRKALKDVEVKESRQTALISKGTPALRSSPEDDFLDSTSKYVRRGSVKEMSEKFIQREGSSTVTEKSNNYPKAGLILRTNSRKNSRDAENENENFESYKTTRVQQQHTSTVLADSDDAEYEVEEVASRHSGRFITESESECDSIKTQREFKKVTSSSSSSMATRSFLNTQGEEKVITNVSDCLERMRNADNVVEEGDTPEDQEARALLNKFLGASIIMKGVESSLPGGSNRQSKIITTTTTSSNLSDDNNDGDNNAKHEVKTTRITKTIKSGSSSTPVTYTTCDIEEIWDEEILKELLEQARTYEERRKIRSRLRELMADREEQKQQQKSSTSTTEKTETKDKDGAVVTTTTKVTTRTVTGSAAKPASPFAKFKQLDRQNSQQSAKSPTTPTTPGGGSTASPTSGKQPIFKFTDPALNAKAATVKEQLLQWCQSKTQEYENIEITNFSTSWNNGLAFCALIHHFLPDAFDYSQLTPKNRRKNFELAFTVADEKAGIAPLLDVEDMVVMQRPDWKCVFVYVQSIYRRFRNCQ